jgi:hypothetical protein
MLVVWTYADSDNTSIPHDPDTPGASYVTFINEWSVLRVN